MLAWPSFVLTEEKEEFKRHIFQDLAALLCIPLVMLGGGMGIIAIVRLAPGVLTLQNFFHLYSIYSVKVYLKLPFYYRSYGRRHSTGC